MWVGYGHEKCILNIFLFCSKYCNSQQIKYGKEGGFHKKKIYFYFYFHRLYSTKQRQIEFLFSYLEELTICVEILFRNSWFANYTLYLLYLYIFVISNFYAILLIGALAKFNYFAICLTQISHI